MKIISAGILAYRFRNQEHEVLLVHPGGPYFKNKDEGYWTIPKGLPKANEALIDTARREFKEETGIEISDKLTDLGTIQQKGGKVIHAWMTLLDQHQAESMKSNNFELEWPPKSGKIQKFPEIDQFKFLKLRDARVKMNQAQTDFLDRMTKLLMNTQ